VRVGIWWDVRFAKRETVQFTVGLDLPMAWDGAKRCDVGITGGVELLVACGFAKRETVELRLRLEFSRANEFAKRFCGN